MNDLCDKDKPSRSIGIEIFMYVVRTSRVLQRETKKARIRGGDKNNPR